MTWHPPATCGGATLKRGEVPVLKKSDPSRLARGPLRRREAGEGTAVAHEMRLIAEARRRGQFRPIPHAACMEPQHRPQAREAPEAHGRKTHLRDEAAFEAALAETDVPSEH